MRRVLGGLCLAAGAMLARADAPVELDFFEYLGAMVEVDGEWVDPIAMQEQDENGTQDVATTDIVGAAQDDLPAVDGDEDLEKTDD